MNSFKTRLAPAAILLSMAVGAIGCSTQISPGELAAGENSSGAGNSHNSDAQLVQNGSGAEADAGESSVFPELSSEWLADGNTIRITTYGSSSCVPEISEVTVSGSQELSVEMELPDENRFCTMDYVPQMNEFAAPAGIDGQKVAHILVQLPNADSAEKVELSPQQ